MLATAVIGCGSDGSSPTTQQTYVVIGATTSIQSDQSGSRITAELGVFDRVDSTGRAIPSATMTVAVSPGHLYAASGPSSDTVQTDANGRITLPWVILNDEFGNRSEGTLSACSASTASPPCTLEVIIRESFGSGGRP